MIPESTDGWALNEMRFSSRTARAVEGLFTLGSGYLHVRGSLEEHLSDAPQNLEYLRLPANVTSERFPDIRSRWGTYVPGVFGPHPLLNRQMINLPYFLGLAPIIDGERLDVEACEVSEYRRTLRLDTALLRRTLRWRTRSGADASLDIQRFISATRPHVCVQRIAIRAVRAVRLVVVADVDTDVRTNGHDHFAAVSVAAEKSGELRAHVRTDGGDELFIVSQVLAPVSPARVEIAARRAALVYEAAIPAESEVVFEKRTAVTTSRDQEPSQPREHLDAARGRSFGELYAEHAAAWRARWDRADVLVEGDARSQLAIRAALYHLLRAHVPGDPRVAIDGKGYAGEAYWGRYFWDTEMFLLPFFLYTDPQRARTLVEFRIRTLDGARRNARRYGYPGARYAWESDAAGLECCPSWQYADHEVHVTADVVYGLAHYARATGQAGFLRGPAAHAIVETARYWLARLDRRAGEEQLDLLGVMGPDEYTPLASNNAFTNRMVMFALRLAAEVGQAGGASAEECAAFQDAAERLRPPTSPDGLLVLQCEEFERLAEPRFEELWPDRSRTFAAQVSQERLYRSKCLKQADVLMLMMLFPEDFSDAQVRRAWDYYLPYTTHDSSLSAGVHAMVALRLGLAREAWSFWERAIETDLDVDRGGAAEGIHIANAGAIWQVATFGFAGLRTAVSSEVLTVQPRLPPGWTRLAFFLIWRGCPVRIDIRPGRTSVVNEGSCELHVVVNGRPRTVAAGARETWDAAS